MRRASEACGDLFAGRDGEASVSGGDGEESGESCTHRGKKQILRLRGILQACCGKSAASHT